MLPSCTCLCRSSALGRVDRQHVGILRPLSDYQKNQQLQGELELTRVHCSRVLTTRLCLPWWPCGVIQLHGVDPTTFIKPIKIYQSMLGIVSHSSTVVTLEPYNYVPLYGRWLHVPSPITKCYQVCGLQQSDFRQSSTILSIVNEQCGQYYYVLLCSQHKHEKCLHFLSTLYMNAYLLKLIQNTGSPTYY